VPLPPRDIREPRDLAPLLEHSVLRSEATAGDVQRACAEARAHHFGAVCVRPAWVADAARELAGSGVPVVAVVDFPDGRGSTEDRVREAREAVARGAREVDVVLQLAPLRTRDHRAVFRDLAAIVAGCGVPVKVILETCRLHHDEKVAACALAKAAGAAWVKTSTGFAEGGATEADVALLREVVGADCGVKASGGIRTADQAMRMARAGADRIGTSASVAVVEGRLSAVPK